MCFTCSRISVKLALGSMKYKQILPQTFLLYFKNYFKKYLNILPLSNCISIDDGLTNNIYF